MASPFVEIVPTDSVVITEESTRLNLSPEDYAALKANVSEHGVVYPLTVDKNLCVLDYVELAQACKELGFPHIPVVVYENGARTVLSRDELRMSVAQNIAHQAVVGFRDNVEAAFTPIVKSISAAISNFTQSVSGDIQPFVEAVSEYLESHPELLDPAVSDDEDEEISQDELEDEGVDLIASGYEWVCPKCDWKNDEFEVTETVTCKSCGATFKVDDYNHAVG
ncbi:hypothetical protein ADN00_15575 [Ornatilinea apprima]|uniref:ParB-like N-terminal domain-containing protein n=1 Tax=Ornatilinea apprima TaxID=1134406 RepID=A0A0P6WZJ1_9CHLR|nr:hypothetical protein [Ornatilinea apprima]KPL72236.1 hypothetical protein ADN00_15575 [Ornatilinea apprima]